MLNVIARPEMPSRSLALANSYRASFLIKTRGRSGSVSTWCKEDEPTREEGQDASIEPPLEGLQKTLHHIEAIKHILNVSGTRPEPLELTLRNLEKLFDKGHAQVRDA